MAKNNVLVVTTEQPGQYGGGPVRNFNLLKQLVRSKKFQVRIVYLAQPIAGRTHRALTKNIPGLTGRRLPLVNRSPLLTIRALLARRVIPDFEVFRCSGLADAVLKEIKQNPPKYLQLSQVHAYYALREIIPELQSRGIKIILDAHNVEYEAFKSAIQYYRTPRKLVGRFLLANLKSLEAEAVGVSDLVLCCTERDQRVFQKVRGHDQQAVIVVPNGVDIDYFQPLPLSKELSLIFTGGTQYPPNEEALRFYFDKIHPRLKRRVPKIKIYLLGGETKPWIRRLALHDKNIVIPGFVPDIKKYLAAARVAISPTRSGSGSSVKILEFLASAKPTVTTRFGARGVHCTDNVDILITDSATKFANYIEMLMADSAKCRNLGLHARRTMEKFYSWDVIGEAYLDALMRTGKL